MAAQNVNLQPKSSLKEVSKNVAPGQTGPVTAPLIPGTHRNVPPKPQDKAIIEAAIASRAPAVGVPQYNLGEALPNGADLPELDQIFVGSDSSVVARPTGEAITAPAATAHANNKKHKKGNKPQAPAPALMQVQDIPNKPPSTIHEYLESRKPDDTPEPEITDIFAGRTADKPVTGIVHDTLFNPPPPPPATVVPPNVNVVHTYEYPDKSNALIITTPITVYIDSQPMNFKKGQIVDDPMIIESMISGGGTFFESYETDVKMITCPCPCGHKFPLPLAR